MQENEMDIALAALNAAIEHLMLKQLANRQFTLKKYTLEDHQRLDVAALKALNVFPQNNETVTGKAGSLFGLLNECKTQIGQRLLKKWLKQPTTSIKGKLSHLQRSSNDSTSSTSSTKTRARATNSRTHTSKL